MSKSLKQSTGQNLGLSVEKWPLRPLSPNVAVEDSLSLGSRRRLNKVRDRETTRLIEQDVMNKTDAAIHIGQLQVMSQVSIAGTQIALRTALAEQSLVTECSKVSAEGCAQLENECYNRSKGFVMNQVAEEKDLKQLVKDGKLTEEYAEILRENSLERTSTLINGDRALTRQFSDKLRQFSLMAVTGLKGSSSGSEDT